MKRSLRRRPPQKAAGEVLFIAVEGKTEADYFECLRGRLRIPRQRLRIVNVGHGPVSEVKRFIDGLPGNRRYRDQYGEIDWFWGVADTEWGKSWKRCASRTAQLPSRGRRRVFWALSSASFERWLLLHFVDSPAVVDAQHLAKALSKHLVGYSHQHKGLTEQQLDELWDRHALALKRADLIRRSGLDSDDAFTDVDMLVQQVLSMSPDDRA